MRKLLLTLIALACFAGPARAIDFNTPILELDGTVPRDDKGQEINLTVGRIVINALMQPQQGDDAESGEDKIKRGVMAERIYKKEDYKFSIEELGIMKKRVNKANSSPLVVRKVWEELEKK